MKGVQKGRADSGRSPVFLAVVPVVGFKRGCSLAPTLRVQVQPFQNRQRLLINSAAFVTSTDPASAIHQLQIVLTAEQDTALKACLFSLSVDRHSCFRGALITAFFMVLSSKDWVYSVIYSIFRAYQDKAPT